MPRLPKQSENFSDWYLGVIKEADLAEYSKVKGCMVIKPYGYALWEAVQGDLNRRIKAAGVQNVYFPLFIPESFLNKEKEHVEGFSPETAVVTHAGGKKLAEPLVIRPTSETVMYDTFSDWVKSYRDLPLLINQWANVVRWEMRTRPFLRTTEFLWQEGHTAHADLAGANEEAHRALKMYQDFEKEFLAMPVRTGRKSKKETFAGAYYTLTTEALARDGKAIQAATSHNLGQGFAKAFDIQYQDDTGQKQFVWQTSWGMSTRIIGTLIVVHGDDNGLRLPPSIAPHQIVIVPIYKNDEEREKVMTAVTELKSGFGPELRVHVDSRAELTPGFKFNEWEVKGVPLRIELGPKDLEKKQVVMVRRDTLEKTAVSLAEASETAAKILAEIQENLYVQALKYQEDNTYKVPNFKAFQDQLDKTGGFFEVNWCEGAICEQAIQEKTKATSRLIVEGAVPDGVCFACGLEAKVKALFARAY